MTDSVPDIGEFAQDMQTAHCAVVAAVVIALHENGVLSRASYCDVLQPLWTEIPDDEALGEAGAMVERALDLSAARTCGSSSAIEV